MIGEVGPAHDLGFFMPKAEDFPNEGGVVMVAAASDGGGAFPDLAADGAVFEVFHDGDHGGGFEGDAPDGFFVGAEVFGFGVSEGCVDGGLGQA